MYAAYQLASPGTAPNASIFISRASLVEIQHAEVGRKFATIDRRPLDPPPSALLKLYTNDGGVENEVDSSNPLAGVGRLCVVDLFPASQKDYEGAVNAEPTKTRGELSPTRGSSGSSTSSQSKQPSSTAPAGGPVVQIIDDESIYESMKLTMYLVGQREVSPTVAHWRGEKHLIFAFGDLSIQREGRFFLRYRTFDLQTPGDEHVVDAECTGRTFRVYSTKDFPGLATSTELTKELALRGASVNVRVHDRKRPRNEGEETQGLGQED
ncbi:velvet factor [Pterulicium gracile]|uniref:Velvet factor n=1 Tax=Pterulicium gracile TaxID=1884261 RepID=A0A5C3QT21_9AGAR|nr:velvet factor [Pterula gracilis]